MSKYFRSMSSSSSSLGDESHYHKDDTSDAVHSNGHSLVGTEEITARMGRVNAGLSTTNDGPHSQMLLHALLEERCINEARREHVSTGQQQRDDEAVRCAADAKYQRLCNILGRHNLISSGLEKKALATARQRYRDGLDFLSRSSTPSATQQASVPVPLRRLLTQTSDGPASETCQESLQLARLHSEASSVFDVIAPAHPILEPSRYLRDFDELGILGKGGYGIVHQVRNRLDGLEYAVKKVPISPARLARIRDRGQTELDELLIELRTLARLEHPNIVRYFSGWIEWMDVASLHPRSSDSGLSLQSNGLTASDGQEDAVLGADDDRGLQRIVTQSESGPAGVLFETSLSRQTSGSDISVGVPEQSHTDPSNTSNFIRSAPGPLLALHLQMGLYPMTLADFISPKTMSQMTVTPLAHCFHLQPSISIILALIDGVEYLHSQGIVHRDLKPANIFIAAHDNPRNTRGSVDLFLCSECRVVGEAQPMTLKVRIGDFGLVATLAARTSNEDHCEPPAGTAMYRPAKPPDSNLHLDIYALGIIAFELLCKFDTRMERDHKIKCLKRDGTLPHHFSERVDPTGHMGGCIRDMLAHSTGVTLQSLRQRLRVVQEAS